MYDILELKYFNFVSAQKITCLDCIHLPSISKLMNFCMQVDGFDYVCQVNGVSLTAQYVNENSILCLVSANDVRCSM